MMKMKICRAETMGLDSLFQVATYPMKSIISVKTL